MKRLAIVEISQEVISQANLVAENLLDKPEQWPQFVFDELHTKLGLSSQVEIIAARIGDEQFLRGTILLKLKGAGCPEVPEGMQIPKLYLDRFTTAR